MAVFKDPNFLAQYAHRCHSRNAQDQKIALFDIHWMLTRGHFTAADVIASGISCICFMSERQYAFVSLWTTGVVTRVVELALNTNTNAALVLIDIVLGTDAQEVIMKTVEALPVLMDLSKSNMQSVCASPDKQSIESCKLSTQALRVIDKQLRVMVDVLSKERKMKQRARASVSAYMHVHSQSGDGCVIPTDLLAICVSYVDEASAAEEMVRCGAVESLKKLGSKAAHIVQAHFD